MKNLPVLATVFGLLLGVAACDGGDQGDASAVRGTVAASDQLDSPATQDETQVAPTELREPAVVGSDASPSETGGSSPTKGGEPARQNDVEESGATPTVAPQATHPSGIPISGQLSPLCVQLGGTMSISILANPESPVAYNAVYDGEEGGSGPPYGEGHGGNASGMSTDDGRYSDTWVVSLNAPGGPARVDVVTAWNGEFEMLKLEFEVVDPLTGLCS